MKDFILISKGRKGQFTIEKDSLGECLAEGTEHVKEGQECSVFAKHSDLVFQDVTVVKSAYQNQKEAAEAKVAEAAPISIAPPISMPSMP